MRFSIEAEQSVIGGLLLDPNRLDDVLEICTADDFYNLDNQLIFGAICDMGATGKTVDVITLSEKLNDSGELERVGGLGYLVEIANNTPSAANVKAYASILADRAMERRITDAGQRIAELGDNESIQVDDKLDTLHGELAGLERKDSAKELVGTDQVLKECLKTLDEKHRGIFPEGVKTGFAAVDERFQWLSPGDLWVIGGRPGQGKTVFGLNICNNIAAATGKEALIFSIEMPYQQLMNRMISATAGILAGRMKSGQLEDDDWNKLSAAVLRLKQMKLNICDTAGIDISRLKAIARSRARAGNLGVILVDYLQLVRDRKYLKPIDIVSSVSVQLKEIAKMCRCPVIALAQLNRSVETRANKRPGNADLRESGQIEQDADIISFLYRDEYYYEDSPNKGMVEVITTKMRDGEVGRDVLASELQFSRFADLKYGSYNEDWQEQQQKPTGRRSFD
jgi:replicative DNA helicase